MSEDATDNAWNTFWDRERKAGRADNGGGCLPAGWQGIADTQKRVWHSFSRTLPKGARVLDLATGDGIVLKMIMEKRRDLNLFGVDRAESIPTPPAGITLRGGVSMEDIPYPDNRFAAVTSQFGFEYGDIERAAAEIARVIQPSGKLGLITHRLSGPIVSHNRKRKEQIAWAIETEGLIDTARNSLGLRDAGIAAIPQAIIDAPAKGASTFGNGSAAWEIAEAVRQTLHMGRNDDPARVRAILDDIQAQASNEMGRIASLESAAATASDVDNVVAVLEKAGLAFRSEALLTDGVSASPFADFRTYARVD
ncbi:class I SAM-dependent methyltransferase [Aurantiacibacter sp. D1-12]|uniref:class I SAM-dependent methyltransferase n=1 Tax=Aurantiacibacter sp. D1-12 TaxID=2993658 RepID=UPI00237CEACA|nr:methyltransferase domain-containing protein [Aurantiacibacter sp. D1-12]MDE1468319.1 methyltransferase domain-containing protein [Aurantiacibacter sp. D1-12]